MQCVDATAMEMAGTVRFPGMAGLQEACSVCIAHMGVRGRKMGVSMPRARGSVGERA